MPASALGPRVIAAIAACAAVGLGLHTYTLPNHAGAAYGDLQRVITQALGDPGETLPGPPAFALIGPLTPDTATPRPEAARHRASPLEAWASRMVARDTEAMRDWLGDLVLVTAAVQGDTVRTTLWRLTTTRGCPWLSRLHALSTGQGTGDLRLVSAEADCPAQPA